jgi:hypothetical protein
MQKIEPILTVSIPEMTTAAIATATYLATVTIQIQPIPFQTFKKQLNDLEICRCELKSTVTKQFSVNLVQLQSNLLVPIQCKYFFFVYNYIIVMKNKHCRSRKNRFWL